MSDCRTVNLNHYFRHFVSVPVFLKESAVLNLSRESGSVKTLRRDVYRREPQDSNDFRITRVFMVDVSLGAS